MARSTSGNKNNGPIPVDSLKHQDRRPNIPTEELRDFVAEDEKRPATLLYPRDPSLDPQLVWKGKDEQDGEPLAVQAVPVYIQEKIHPQALIENLRDTARRGEVEPELTLFADFNGIEFEELIDFYQHDQNWSNRMILGDSLMVMASLAEKEGFKGKVQTIYLDPPYGIKFGSNWQVSTRNRDVKDGKVDDVTRQPEQIKAFRDTWELGIHSYLSYLRDRLVVARDLLTESGSVFVQIGDENVHLVRCLMDEVFGAENFVGEIVFVTTSGRASIALDLVADRLLWYAKDSTRLKYRGLYKPRPEHTLLEQYTLLELADGSVRRLTDEERQGLVPLPAGARRFMPGDLTSQGSTTEGSGSYTFGGSEYSLPPNTHWKTSNPQGLDALTSAGRLWPIGKRLRYKRYEHDFPVATFTNLWDDTVTSGFSAEKLYVVQTNVRVIERCLLMTTDPGDLVLDLTCGSGTTAYVAEQWGRRWITVDTSRVALALARTRLMCAKYPYYLLADSPAGVRKEAEVTGRVPGLGSTQGDVKKGFVYKRVPHVTLKSIANSPDIREGMSRAEIDAAIARHADTELLYDQPYDHAKHIRVAGPFTVESLSPHRVLPADSPAPTAAPPAPEQTAAGQYELMVLTNLRKAGVQNTIKNERLRFERLDPYPGSWLQGAGEYKEGDTVRRVAVAIGPEFGTVGPLQVKEAAKEAVQGLGFDTLVVCGFAFDPHVSEETKRWGTLTVLVARMNPDLTMGEELLKKTGGGNLFMVFGEPDIELTSQPDGQLVAEVRGLDVYDPTTGQIRSNDTEKIACWFIDTDYNGESFFVRHAYFTGGDEPYQRLQRALRAEIDEATWASLYSTRSRPFAKPETGKIAVKVINYYGDEVLKVYEI